MVHVPETKTAPKWKRRKEMEQPPSKAQAAPSTTGSSRGWAGERCPSLNQAIHSLCHEQPCSNVHGPVRKRRLYAQSGCSHLILARPLIQNGKKSSHCYTGRRKYLLSTGQAVSSKVTSQWLTRNLPTNALGVADLNSLWICILPQSEQTWNTCWVWGREGSS